MILIYSRSINYSLMFLQGSSGRLGAAAFHRERSRGDESSFPWRPEASQLWHQSEERGPEAAVRVPGPRHRGGQRDALTPQIAQSASSEWVSLASVASELMSSFISFFLSELDSVITFCCELDHNIYCCNLLFYFALPRIHTFSFEMRVFIFQLWEKYLD